MLAEIFVMPGEMQPCLWICVHAWGDAVIFSEMFSCLGRCGLVC